MRNSNFKVEETNAFALTRERFIDLCLEKLKEKGAILTQQQDDFHWKADFGDKKIMQFYLGNIWQNYQRSKDLGVVTGYIDTQVEMFEYMDDIDKHGLDVEKVFPTFRKKGFDVNAGARAKEMGAESEKKTMKDAFSDDLDILYVQDHPKFVSLVIEDQIPAGYTVDTLADKAFENLKKQGWVEPFEKIPVDDVATVYFFSESVKPYQAQFMVKELYEKHLGDYFMLALPTRDDAIAVVWHKNPDDYFDLGMHLATTLKKQALNMYHTGGNPLTPILHRIRPGEVKLLG